MIEKTTTFSTVITIAFFFFVIDEITALVRVYLASC